MTPKRRGKGLKLFIKLFTYSSYAKHSREGGNPFHMSLLTELKYLFASISTNIPLLMELIKNKNYPQIYLFA